ncbi:MAG: aldo/keto reductase [Actinobacteria bacterium]|nr:aldo/keto reductase [Actinomycetota bacterium]
MEYKILGKTGLTVSSIAFGALQFARIDRKEAINLVHLAYDYGINLIDTAHNYPGSEEILGEALKNIRDKIYIITKSLSRNKKEFLNDFNMSLKKLNTDYIDIFMFHSISKENEFELLKNEGIIEALVKEKKKGKVRFIGFSCHNPQVIDRFYELDDFSTLMVPLNFMTGEYVQKQIYEKFEQFNIGLLAMKPFGGGRLADIELCFKFLRNYPKFIPVAGMQNLKELEENIKYLGQADLLNENDKEKIKKISQELGTKFCRQCGYCMPCPKNISITDVNFIKVYYKQMPMDKFYNMGLKEIVKTAKTCTECGECSEKCPFNLDVPAIIKENIEFYESISI